MDIHKSVAAATLAELFDIPMHWDKSGLRQKITSLGNIWVHSGGCVTGSFGLRQCLALGNGSYEFSLDFFLWTCSAKNMELRNSSGHTLEQLLRICDTGTETRSTWQMPCPERISPIGTTVRTITISLTAGDMRIFQLCLESVSTPCLAALERPVFDCILTIFTQLQQLTGFLTSDALFDLKIVLDEWKFDSQICLNNDDPPPPLETDLDNVMRSVTDLYQRSWPAMIHKTGRFVFKYLRISVLCVEIKDTGGGGFAGILSPDPEDVNAFWSIKYRMSDYVDRRELSRARFISP
jgi:hypothetical protein